MAGDGVRAGLGYRDERRESGVRERVWGQGEAKSSSNSLAGWPGESS